MTDYYKIYHYSRESDLKNIDPHFFGSGVLYGAFKRGAQGLNKSYYFIDPAQQLPNPLDRPYRYEVYLPCEWKIYDLDKDPEKFYDDVLDKIKKEQLYPYDWLVAEKIEQLLLDKGYKGRLHAQGIALALFHPLSTKKPKGPGKILDFATHNVLAELSDLDNLSDETAKFNSAGTNANTFFKRSQNNNCGNEVTSPMMNYTRLKV